MEIINIIKDCRDGKRRSRDIEDIDLLAIHRIWFDDIDLEADLSPKTICRRFVHDPEVAKYTGGEVPYTFIIGRDGKIYQCLEIKEVGPHARRWNTRALGIGVMGDFRKQAVPRNQYTLLVDFLVELCGVLDIHPLNDVDQEQTVSGGPGKYVRGEVSVPQIAGHSELPGGSKDKNKQCPGKYLSMHQLRFDVATMIRESSIQKLVQTGLVV